MGWVIAALLAAGVVVGLWLFGRFRGESLTLLVAALCLALAGYAWQGQPRLAGAPAHPQSDDQFRQSVFSEDWGPILGRFTASSQWLTIADSLTATGDTQGAVDLLRNGIRQHPNDWNLWIGLGNALVMHAGGAMTPAAQLAFERAQHMAPGSPAPLYFYGLALAESGRFDEAEALWRGLLQVGPKQGEWRDVTSRRVEAIDRMRAMIQRMQAQPKAQ